MRKQTNSARQFRFGRIIVGVLTLFLAPFALLGVQYILFWTPPNATCAATESTQIGPTNEIAADFRVAVARFRASEDAPGIQAALIAPNGDLIAFADGSADRKATCPMTLDHVLHIGSVSKLVTSVLFYEAATNTSLSTEQHLTDIIAVNNLPHDTTFDDLLHHNAGAVELTRSLWFVYKLFQPAYRFSTAEVALASDWYEPAERGQFKYTNSNFMLIGRAIELAVGTSMSDLLANRFPEGGESAIYWENVPVDAAVPRGYDRDVVPFPGDLDMTPFRRPYESGGFAAAGFLSDAVSLTRFVDGLFSAERGRHDPALFAYLTKSIPAAEADHPALVAYGSGTRILEINGERWIGHTGTQTGYSGLAFHNLDADYSVALLANLSQIDQAAFMTELSNLLSNK